MKKISGLIIIAFAFLPVFAQRNFELKNASKFFDVEISVNDCDENSCRGTAAYSFYKKGAKKPYQVIKLSDTYIDIDESGIPRVNETLLYDKQSALNIGDFNFDGMEDVAISNGTNGSYQMPSYNVYLSSKKEGKFVFSEAFSYLGKHLGMFEIDKKKKVLRIFDKSGCCWHIVEEYSVVNNRPVKVFVKEEDATISDETKVKITTKTLVNGKWQTKVNFAERK